MRGLTDRDRLILGVRRACRRFIEHNTSFKFVRRRTGHLRTEDCRLTSFHDPDLDIGRGTAWDGKCVWRSGDVGAVIRNDTGRAREGRPITVRISTARIGIVFNINVTHVANHVPGDLPGLLDVIILVGQRRGDIDLSLNGKVGCRTDDIRIFHTALISDQF